MPHLRLATYNVRYFGHESGGLASQERTLQRVALRMATLPGGIPDLIALQELETNSIRADLARRRPKGLELAAAPQHERLLQHLHRALTAVGSERRYRSYYFPAHRYDLAGRAAIYTTGLAVLVPDHLEVLADNSESPFDITHRRIAATARWKQTRICAHVRVKHPNGRVLDLYNTHLSLPAFLTRDFLLKGKRMGYGINQIAEAEALFRFIEDTRDAAGAAVVVGDFNSLPGSPVYRFITEDAGFRDAFRTFHDLSEPHPADFPTAGALRYRLPIDYVFSCDGVRWIDFDETHPYGVPEAAFHGLSDHVPLVARLRLLDP
jgi:endonuclease/exonuclease/phosphatase family metal-dependent hydrolase